MRRRFGAKWGRWVIGITLLTSVLVVGAAFASQSSHAILAAAAVLLGTALFGVYGYSVESGALLIHRLGWITRIELDELELAQVWPGAMGWSYRVLGNGGLFAFVGYFRNRQLGPYRAFVTRREDAVVLKVGGKTIVVSPDAPEAFVAAVEAAAGR